MNRQRQIILRVFANISSGFSQKQRFYHGVADFSLSLDFAVPTQLGHFSSEDWPFVFIMAIPKILIHFLIILQIPNTVYRLIQTCLIMLNITSPKTC